MRGHKSFESRRPNAPDLYADFVNSVVWASPVGVFVGSDPSFVGQYLTLRHNSSAAKAKRLRMQRDEWRAPIREFLDEAQRAEARCVHRYHHGAPPDGASSDQLWLLQKCIEITCPFEIAKTSGPPPGDWIIFSGMAIVLGSQDCSAVRRQTSVT